MDCASGHVVMGNDSNDFLHVGDDITFPVPLVMYTWLCLAGGDGEYEGSGDEEDDEATLDQEEALAAADGGNCKVQIILISCKHQQLPGWAI